MIYDVPSYVGRVKGRRYTDVEAELIGSGFRIEKSITLRQSGNRKLRFLAGHHENTIAVDIVHKWEVDHYGIGRPGTIVSAAVVDRKEKFQGEIQ